MEKKTPIRSSSVNYLIGLIKKYGIRRICQAIHDPIIMVSEGWDLTRWQFQQVKGAVLFIPITYTSVITDEQRLLVVNAPLDEQPKWQTIANESDVPCVAFCLRETK